MTPQLILYLGYIMLTDFEFGSFMLSKRARKLTEPIFNQLKNQFWCHLSLKITL